MPARLAARAPRVVLVASLLMLATATLTLAATQTIKTAKPTQPAATPAPAELVVPDVRNQAYVFAKAALEEAGFAWRIAGAVQGYAANTVVDQTPAPGTRVVDTGMPTLTLRLARNPAYDQEGTPENASPYQGDPLQLVRSAPLPQAKPVATPQPKAAPKPAPKPAAKAEAEARTPDFAVPGAPKEPADEIALPERAKRLAAWLEAHPEPTDANVDHWLYQHNWIVTGAEYGWWHGAEALRTLIAVDRRAQQLWGIGARSEQLARATLARVEAKRR